jgi:thymidylate synthase (FAD)
MIDATCTAHPVLPIKVLDKGFVRLENFSGGGDNSVVRAARVSYGSESISEEKDKKLIAYMLKHRHGTPFEHNSFTFHVKAPIFVFRQWHRTRIGVSYNEMSARYTEVKDDFYLPSIWRAQETGTGANKQGSVVSATLNHKDISEHFRISCEDAMQSYRTLLAAGVAREMARMVLPVNLYSEMYFTTNARALMFFLGLRSDAHAQWETQQFSNALAEFFRGAMPWTYEAFYQSIDKTQYVGLPTP